MFARKMNGFEVIVAGEEEKISLDRRSRDTLRN